MSNTLQRSNSKRFSRDGFKPIPNQFQSDMGNPNDATIDIPLEQVQSNGGGLRNQSSTTALRPSDTNAAQSPGSHHLFFRGRRRNPKAPAAEKTGRVGYDGEEDTINTMGKVYKRIRDFSVLVCIAAGTVL